VVPLQPAEWESFAEGVATLAATREKNKDSFKQFIDWWVSMQKEDGGAGKRKDATAIVFWVWGEVTAVCYPMHTQQSQTNCLVLPQVCCPNAWMWRQNRALDMGRWSG